MNFPDVSLTPISVMQVILVIAFSVFFDGLSTIKMPLETNVFVHENTFFLRTE